FHEIAHDPGQRFAPALRHAFELGSGAEPERDENAAVETLVRGLDPGVSSPPRLRRRARTAHAAARPLSSGFRILAVRSRLRARRGAGGGAAVGVSAGRLAPERRAALDSEL